METSATRVVWCLGSRPLAPGAVVTPAKGGGKFSLEDASSDGIRYLGAGVHCLVRRDRGCSSVETGSANFYVTADEDPTCSS